MTWTPQQLDNRVQQPDVSALSDAAAATAICADYRTASPIPLLPLRQWLNQQGIQSRIQRTTSSVVFTTVCTDQGMTPAQQQATADKIDDAISYIATGGIGANLDTTDNTRAGQTHNLLGLMQACNGKDATVGMTAAEAATFLSYGGGITFGAGSVATADVTASRTRITLSQNYATAQQLGAHQYNSFANWLASGQAAGTAAPTTAQVLSYLGTQQP